MSFRVPLFDRIYPVPRHMRQPRSRRLAALFLVCAGLSGSPVRAGQTQSPLEQSICGIKEPFVFWLWNLAAGDADPARLRRYPAVTPVAITAGDGRVLRGYRLVATPAAEDTSQPLGYLLVGQGNAMLADRVIPRLAPFAGAGYDVYVFDYRGYGRSEGKRRLKAILDDYRGIIGYLDSLGYRKQAFYGLSFGGVVLLDALRNRAGEMTVVIDSTPGRLSDYGCPRTHDPLANLPADARRFLFIAGAADRVVHPEAAAELLEAAEQRGATVIRDPVLGHPFQDGQSERRLDIVRHFLTGEARPFVR